MRKGVQVCSFLSTVRMLKDAKKDGDVYLISALALPADCFGRLRCLGLDALLSAAVCTEPLGELVFDSFFRDDGVVTHLVPA